MGFWFFSDFVVDKSFRGLRPRDFGPVRTCRCYPSHALSAGPSRSRSHGRLRRPKSLGHPSLVLVASAIIFLAFLSLGDDAPHLLPGVLVNERGFGMRRKAPLTGSRCGQCSPLFWRLLYSVLKKAFWCTEWTCGVKTGLLRYATRCNFYNFTELL